MNQSLRHRGPDSHGIYEEAPFVVLAMRRLAIIDVGGGDQPMSNEDHTVWAVFNGEIYNFQSLRADLESRGHVFRTSADTEVIVHGYEEWGDELPSHLRGMFCFAVWDSKVRKLMLARDRVGIKPLFYAKADGQLIWGSEIKALLRHPAVAAERALNPSALNEFLTFLYVPSPQTIFDGISELPPGHVLIANANQVQLRPYWRLEYRPDRSMSRGEFYEGLRAELDDAVKVRMISEVPLGAFLSGGIDSGAIVALMAGHASEPINSFSIGYSSGAKQFDERAFARELAERYSTNHREFEMTPDIASLVPDLVQAFDQPFADSTAIPTWYLCQMTRKHVTVALSGVGGDEIAGGYERHRAAALGKYLDQIPGWLSNFVIRPLTNRLPDSNSGNQWPSRLRRIGRTLDMDPDDRFFELISTAGFARREELLTPEIQREIDLNGPRACFGEQMAQLEATDPLDRALFADLKLYLPGDLLTLTDRISMAHSLEVRVPYLDHHVIEFAARIPPEVKLRRLERKHVLKRAVRTLLPKSFLRRRKMGFSAPLPVWFRGDLREFVEDSLGEQRLRRAGVFRPAAVRRVIDQHMACEANHDNLIWALIMFTEWEQRYLSPLHADL